jgi:hypothetical protein
MARSMHTLCCSKGNTWATCMRLIIRVWLMLAVSAVTRTQRGEAFCDAALTGGLRPVIAGACGVCSPAGILPLQSHQFDRDLACLPSIPSCKLDV